MTIKYQVIYWRDIPAQLKFQAGEKRAGRPLSPRFQEVIDRVAVRADATGDDAYLATWRKSEWQECEGEFDKVAESLAGELESAYPPSRLEMLEQNSGYEPGPAGGDKS